MWDWCLFNLYPLGPYVKYYSSVYSSSLLCNICFFDFEILTQCPHQFNWLTEGLHFIHPSSGHNWSNERTYSERPVGYFGQTGCPLWIVFLNFFCWSSWWYFRWIFCSVLLPDILWQLLSAASISWCYSFHASCFFADHVICFENSRGGEGQFSLLCICLSVICPLY